MFGVEGTTTPRSRSSSSPDDLSSPPHSLSDPGSPAAQQLANEHRNAQNPSFMVNTFGVVDGTGQGQPIVKKKAGRKPGSLNKPKINPDGSSANNTDGSKPKRPRKPRDPNAPQVQRKKKTPNMRSTSSSSVGSKQPRITDVNMRPADATFHVPQPTRSPDGMMAPTSQSSKYEDIQRPINSFFNPAPPPQQAPIRTSGQNYDPVRSNYDPVRETVVHQNSYHNPQMSPRTSQMPNRASASPSISSLVDPPNQASTSPSIATQSFFSHQMKMQNQEVQQSVPPSPTANRHAPSPMMMNSIISAPTAAGVKFDRQIEPWMKGSLPPHFATGTTSTDAPASNGSTSGNPGSTSGNPPNDPNGGTAPAANNPTSLAPSAIPKKSTSNAAISTATSSAAPSPKPPKPIDVTPPPLPGSGLMFGNGPKDGTKSRAPTIALHIPLNGEINKYVNFTRLAEERYGWEALHPRLAAQRERLARVAAAGAALEKNGAHKESGDDMSLDLSDGEGDGSNVEMGGLSDGRTGTDGGKKPVRKRKTKEDEYDKDDGFVDDSELLWEEQAAASKDGFFVYSGPLVPEGEKPALDRPDGTTKRGRGGRGRGITRGSASTRGATASSAGGPGSRGGGITRKPRMTKADRIKMDQEKVERERMGTLAAKPSGYSGMSQLASTAAMGGTPMVFNQ